MEYRFLDISENDGPTRLSDKWWQDWQVYLANNKGIYSVQSEIFINSKKETVWNNLIEVSEIKDNEYEYGLYNYIGVPRPLKSEFFAHDETVCNVH